MEWGHCAAEAEENQTMLCAHGLVWAERGHCSALLKWFGDLGLRLCEAQQGVARDLYSLHMWVRGCWCVYVFYVSAYVCVDVRAYMCIKSRLK